MHDVFKYYRSFHPQSRGNQTKDTAQLHVYQPDYQTGFIFKSKSYQKPYLSYDSFIGKFLTNGNCGESEEGPFGGCDKIKNFRFCE